MQTRAAVAWKAGEPLTIETIEIEGPKPGEVLVEIMATGICHTDAYTLSGADPEGIFPAILGHEGAGVVRGELEAYGQGLADKPEIVALSKADAMTPEQIKAQSAKLKKAAKKTPLVLSAQSGRGVPEALRALLKVIEKSRRGADEQKSKEAAWHP